MARKIKPFKEPPAPKTPVTAVPVPLLAVTNPEISAEELGVMVKAQAFFFRSELREWNGRPYRCPDAKPWPTDSEAQAALVGVDAGWWKERKYLWFLFRNETLVWTEIMRGNSQKYRDKALSRWRDTTDSEEDEADSADVPTSTPASSFPAERQRS